MQPKDSDHEFYKKSHQLYMAIIILSLEENYLVGQKVKSFGLRSCEEKNHTFWASVSLRK